MRTLFWTRLEAKQNYNKLKRSYYGGNCIVPWNEIDEIRGVLDSSQNLEPSLTGVVKRKLDSFKELTDLDKEFYLKAIEDNRKITKIKGFISAF